MLDMKRYGHLAIVAMIGIFSHFPSGAQGPQLMYRKYKRYQCKPARRSGYGPCFSCWRSRLLNSFTRRQTLVSPAG